MTLISKTLAAGMALTLALGAQTALAAGDHSADKKHGEAGAITKNQPVLSGKVVETMTSGGYTYAQIENDGQKTWVAMPETKIKVGEELVFTAGSEMPNFKSTTLKRTFDKIIFTSGPVNLPGAKGDASKASKPVSTEKIKVDKAKGTNAYTVAELYSKAGSLDKKEVVVQGKVVKVSKQIMGKNWVHLQDGTGNPEKGTHNLVVTTEALPAVGDVLTMSGKLAKDKDFGYGYKYEVILEDGAIKK